MRRGVVLEFRQYVGMVLIALAGIVLLCLANVSAASTGEPDAQMASMVAQYVVEIIIALVGLLCTFLVMFLNKMTGLIKEKTRQVADARQQQLIWDALTQVNDVAGKVVQKFEQTIAADLRAEVKAGKVSREKLLVLGKQAYEEVMKTASPEVIKILQKSLGDLQNYLYSAVETKVLQAKRQSGQVL